jgi:hypothetical protein
MKTNNRLILRISAVFIAAPLLLGICAVAQNQEASSESSYKQTLDQINKDLNYGGRAETEQAARKLHSLETAPLSTSERETWVRLARDVAIRSADAEWLRKLQSVPDSFGLDSVYTVLLAYGQLTKADIAGANATLERISDVHALNIREQRRILALRARMAQLRGDTRAERGYIEQIVDHLASWPDAMCQSCHGSTAKNAKMTGLPVRSLWFGERYVELMKLQGDANAVQDRCRAQLKQNPTDDVARIRLAFALIALGKSDDADALLKQISWVTFPGRDLAKPRMIFAFP